MSRGSRQRAALLAISLALAVTAGGCLELVRRPGSGTDTPTWETAVNDTMRQAPSDHTFSRTDRGAAIAQPSTPMDPSPESPTSSRVATGKRPRRARDRVRRVNEYVHWCLERDLWEEARSHLERALAQDSLAASLHNNLGVVREQQGRPLEAQAAYERAWQLQPKKAYSENLRLLRRRLAAAEQPDVPDSLQVEFEAGTAAAPNPNGGAEADSAATRQIQR